MGCFMCGFESTTLTCTNSSCQSCIAVEKLDEEINQVLITLQRLLAARCNVRSEQNRAHDPMHRLPIELRNHIFELLLPRRDKWGSIVRVGGQRNVTVMPTSICRSWNDTASSNPFLWRTMDLLIGGRTFSQIPFVRKWILRGQSIPLVLEIRAQAGAGIEAEMGGILDAISQSSTKLLSLSLDMPNKLLRSFHHSNFPYHHLKRLRISTSPDNRDQPVPLLNPKVSPEVIDIDGVAFPQLQISWNHLTSATISGFECAADVFRLFELASQMTSCQITLVSDLIVENLSTHPGIIHQRLQVFGFFKASQAAAKSLLGHLTFPSLQAFHTDRTVHLTPEILPALIRRSSCPLTRISMGISSFGDRLVLSDLQPFPGVTRVFISSISDATFKKLFLEEYFPDLQHLTLRSLLFLRLWDNGVISELPGLNRPPQVDSEAQGRFKITLRDKRQAFRENGMWNSDLMNELKAFGISFKVEH